MAENSFATMNEIILKRDGFVPEEIAEVVRLHQLEIESGFLGSMGDKTLQLIFTHIAESVSGILVVAMDDTNRSLSGFVCGTSSTARLYKEFLFRKSLRALWYSAPALLSPPVLRRAIETLFYPAKKEETELPAAELLDIAVVKRHQGSGLAQVLFTELVEVFASIGIAKFRIVVGGEMIRAQRFYQKLGAIKKTSFQVHKGENSWVYVYEIPESNTTLL